MEGKIKVLLVDDKADFLDPICFWLKSKGYLVTTASNGREAIEMVKTGKPDIVFLDIHMPTMDGIEALTAIRKFNKEIPIIMLTAYGDEESMSSARKLGISGFFPKKADLEQLTSMLEATLRTHKKLHHSPKKSK